MSWVSVLSKIINFAVKKLLNEGTVAELPLKAATIADLRALCLALLDNLNDKSTALGHQKKTNRLLAAKIATLEQKISRLSGNTNTSLSPSQFLLSGYTSSKVDEEFRVIKEENGLNAGESSESNKSQISSEYETQSLSDISTEFRHFNYIKIINEDEVVEDDEEIDENEIKIEEQLAVLPPDIQKLVDEAMKNSDNETQ